MFQFTDIPKFELTKDTCFVCGKPATTREHLFPKWLQHRFNLWDERIIIPNKTTISYKQLTVPCCPKCNNEVFSALENKLATNTETEADIWRWANKLHFGLSLKDKFLEWDRKNPGYKIGDVYSPNDPLEQSRHFLHCVSGDFQTDPDPFGSVFQFKFFKQQEYNFIHLTNSSSIYISLGDRGYIVFVRDAVFLRDNLGVKEDYTETINKPLLDEMDMRFFYAKLVEFIERFQLSFPVMIMQGKIIKIGNIAIRQKLPVNKELLSAICEHFGFTWIDKDTLRK